MEPLCWPEHCELALVKKIQRKSRQFYQYIWNFKGCNSEHRSVKAEPKEHHRADRGFGLLKKYVKREEWGSRPVRSACGQMYLWVQDGTIPCGFPILFAEVLNSSIFFFFFNCSWVIPSPGRRPHWVGVAGRGPQREAAVLRILHREAVWDQGLDRGGPGPTSLPWFWFESVLISFHCVRDE